MKKSFFFAAGFFLAVLRYLVFGVFKMEAIV